jgi:hypothetical protein
MLSTLAVTDREKIRPACGPENGTFSSGMVKRSLDSRLRFLYFFCDIE